MNDWQSARPCLRPIGRSDRDRAEVVIDERGATVRRTGSDSTDSTTVAAAQHYSGGEERRVYAHAMAAC